MILCPGARLSLLLAKMCGNQIVHLKKLLKMKSIVKHLLVLQLVLVAALGSWAGTGKRSIVPSVPFINGGEPASAIVLRGSLATFNASSGRNCFTLTWNSAVTPSCDHFDVERSLDGVKFEKMGEVKVQATPDAQYSFKDNFRPILARNNDFYYRLRQADLNGQVSYSKMLIARVYNTKSLASLSVTPDPTINDILVNIQLKENAFVVMKISDKSGNQIVRKSEKAQNGMSTYQLEGSNSLAPGQYMLEIIVNSKERLNIALEKS